MGRQGEPEAGPVVVGRVDPDGAAVLLDEYRKVEPDSASGSPAEKPRNSTIRTRGLR